MLSEELNMRFAPKLPATGERERWTGLYGSGQGLAIASAAARYPGLVLVITPDTPAADRIEEQIRFFTDPQTLGPLLHLPDWETLPYDVFSPHQDIVSERLATLQQLPGLSNGILVVPVNTLMGRLCPRKYLEANSLMVRRGERFDIDAMRVRLEFGGYRCVGQVMEHGEFAVRGSLLDMFPMGAHWPFRIDLLDDEIDTIRVFDPDTQRTRDKVDTVELLPAREFPLTEEAVAVFRQAWRARFDGDPRACPVYRDVSEGLAPAGIEYYLPLFFDHTTSLFDYLPGDCLTITLDGTHEAAEAFWLDASARYEQKRHDRERPLLPPSELFLEANEVYARLGERARVSIRGLSGIESQTEHEHLTRAPLSLPVDARAADPLAHVKRFLDGFSGRALFVAETPGRRETLVETFQAQRIEAARSSGWHDFLAADYRLGIAVAPLDQGLVLESPSISIVTEAQLFGERALQRRRRKTTNRDAESVIRELTELSAGSPVVHEHQGVGRYLGLQTLTVGGLTNEFLTLEYAGGDKLYVPVSSLHLVTRYTGAEPDLAPLHKLGSQQWQKARRKAAERAYDVAAELLEIGARRAARAGHVYALEHDQYQTFVQDFPFEETPDQELTINQVLEDMASDAAMDRLVCGDVGFGKTEVAMRASFVAVNDGWQVAVLVPTTLLAQQHYENFSDRFADWPVRVEVVSRFRSRKESDAVTEGLANGSVDIIIGTHKLLQNDVRFKRLGLVIIDEEHRFGVRQKERFKALRAEVDVLTLTATPIPRTLNMALSGLRDLSLIATPPEKRLSIKTFVGEWDTGLVREACLREIRRGGQVYVVHNRVEDIEQLAHKIRTLLPEASVRVGHGQMRERDLEQVMVDFYHRRFNILVCTTIIETGIDVPSANTIVINRADRFGLAQLHQLRGRVGRSHHRAYAYLMAPPRGVMTADAIKRLEAIESLEDLGIGFSLATHDMEIRGAGELLGEGQSGQIAAVGYSLYKDLLERAVAALKAGRSPQLDRPLDHGTEVDIRAPALIPEDYLPDVHTRLIMYKRIASAGSGEDLRELQVEMIDRFGLLPEPTQCLFKITGLKLKATALGIRKIDCSAQGGRILFDSEANVDPTGIVRLVQGEPKTYKLEGGDKLRISADLPDAEARIRALDNLLESLAVREAA